MKVVVKAKTYEEARRVAEETYPNFWYSNSKKVDNERFLVVMSMRRKPTGLIIPVYPDLEIKIRKLNVMVLDFTKSIKTIITEPTEEKRIVKEINKLCRDIQKLIVD